MRAEITVRIMRIEPSDAGSTGNHPASLQRVCVQVFNGQLFFPGKCVGFDWGQCGDRSHMLVVAGLCVQNL